MFNFFVLNCVIIILMFSNNSSLGSNSCINLNSSIKNSPPEREQKNNLQTFAVRKLFEFGAITEQVCEKMIYSISSSLI